MGFRKPGMGIRGCEIGVRGPGIGIRGPEMGLRLNQRPGMRVTGPWMGDNGTWGEVRGTRNGPAGQGLNHQLPTNLFYFCFGHNASMMGFITLVFKYIAAILNIPRWLQLKMHFQMPH